MILLMLSEINESNIQERATRFNFLCRCCCFYYLKPSRNREARKIFILSVDKCESVWCPVYMSFILSQYYPHSLRKNRLIRNDESAGLRRGRLRKFLMVCSIIGIVSSSYNQRFEVKIKLVLGCN